MTCIILSDNDESLTLADDIYAFNETVNGNTPTGTCIPFHLILLCNFLIHLLVF